MVRRMKKRVANPLTLVAHRWPRWQLFASPSFIQKSNSLYDKHTKSYTGTAHWTKENTWFETLHGTVPSGDAHPTTHGNTIGLIFLWNHIFRTEFGWDLLAEEFRVRRGGNYRYPVRIKFCGDDGIFMGSMNVLVYIRDIVIPRYFVTEGVA